MELHEVGSLLEPAPLPLETGWERLASGALHVAVRTDLHGCTGEMLEWWFRWRCTTREYVWWHPVDHVSSTWQGTLAPDTHIGSEHVVREFFSGLPDQDLVIQFRDPAEFFEPDAYGKARESGAVTGAVVGRLGLTHEPPRLADGRVLGGRLLHIARDTGWGAALRSHFFVGLDLPDQRHDPAGLHLQIEAMKRGFHDAHTYVGDPRQVAADGDGRTDAGGGRVRAAIAQPVTISTAPATVSGWTCSPNTSQPSSAAHRNAVYSTGAR